LQLEKNIGIGDNPRNSGDIKVDNDIEAIKNSIRNIFNTRKGQKILSPNFGASLDQFLFERVDNFTGTIIGQTILDNLQRFEPRVEVEKINVYPFPDQNQYNVQVFYKFLAINKSQTMNLSVMNDGQIIL
jgi:phage baseplate assembly protein W